MIGETAICHRTEMPNNDIFDVTEEQKELELVRNEALYLIQQVLIKRAKRHHRSSGFIGDTLMSCAPIYSRTH